MKKARREKEAADKFIEELYHSLPEHKEEISEENGSRDKS